MDLISHIKAGGQVQLADEPVRVLATDLKGDEPLAVAVQMGDAERIYRYRADGTSHGRPHLVPVPRKLSHDISVIFYDDGKHQACRRNEEARFIKEGRIAIERLTVESVEGRGL
jgi:hypothetical protein